MLRNPPSWKRGTPRWIKWLALVGWLLVVGGIVGEGIAESYVSKADGLIQTFNDILLSSSERDSALAQQRASKAILDAGKANERASKNEREAAQLRKEAEHERLGRLKLEALIQPRELKYPWALTYACRSFRGHAVQVASYAADAEAWRLSQQIIDALKNGQIFVIDRTSSFMVMGGFEVGVRVRGPDSEKRLKDAIFEALSEEKLIRTDDTGPEPQAIMQVGGIEPDTKVLTILVGVKPFSQATEIKVESERQSNTTKRQKTK